MDGTELSGSRKASSLKQNKVVFCLRGPFDDDNEEEEEKDEEKETMMTKGIRMGNS